MARSCCCAAWRAAKRCTSRVTASSSRLEAVAESGDDVMGVEVEAQRNAVRRKRAVERRLGLDVRVTVLAEDRQGLAQVPGETRADLVAYGIVGCRLGAELRVAAVRRLDPEEGWARREIRL